MGFDWKSLDFQSSYNLYKMLERDGGCKIRFIFNNEISKVILYTFLFFNK